MKKRYEKPQIVFEDFTLSTNIAGDCEAIVDNPTKGACPVKGTGGINIFSDPNSGCMFTPQGMGQPADMWDGFCYHVPIPEASLFNS